MQQGPEDEEVEVQAAAVHVAKVAMAPPVGNP